jgi:hypothetical protein
MRNKRGIYPFYSWPHMVFNSIKSEYWIQSINPHKTFGSLFVLGCYAILLIMGYCS